MKENEAIERLDFLKQLVEDARVRISDSYPIFIVWGIVWIVGYAGSVLLPADYQAWVWPTILPLAFAAMLMDGVLGRRRGRYMYPSTPLTKNLFRMNLLMALVTFFFIPNLVAEVSERDQMHYIPFMIGFTYLLNGLFVGRELIWIGAWIAIAAFAASFMPFDLASIWMAAAGGGSLVATGWMLRRGFKNEPPATLR